MWFNQDIDHRFPVGKAIPEGGMTNGLGLRHLYESGLTKMLTAHSHLERPFPVGRAIPEAGMAAAWLSSVAGGEDDDHRGVHLRGVLAALPRVLHTAVPAAGVVPAEIHPAALPGRHVAGHELHYVQPHHLLLPQRQVGALREWEHTGGDVERGPRGEDGWGLLGWFCPALCHFQKRWGRHSSHLESFLIPMDSESKYQLKQFQLLIEV